MRFKEFLILESGNNDEGSDWFYGGSLFPSDAQDGGHLLNVPPDFVFLQSRWKRERDEWGRKFHNIKVDDTINKKYTSLTSVTMPETDGGFWKHSKKERPNIKVDNDAKMQLIGHGKTGKVPQVLWKSNDLLDNTEELNRIFGKFEPSYSELATNFDKPWSPYSGEVKMKHVKKKKYSKHLNNF
jgi:hypothetical protein